MQWLGFWSVVLLLCAGAGAASYWVGRNVIGAWGEHGTPVRDLTTSLLAEEKEEGKKAWERRARGARSARPMVEVVPAEPIEEPEEEPTPEEPEEPEESAREEEGTDTPDEREEGPTREGAERESTPKPEKPDEPPEPRRERERPTTGLFVVRAGSFTDDEYLEERKAALRQRGYSPWVTEYTKDGMVYHRVNVAQCPTRQEAELLKKELAQVGIDADVVAPGG